MKRDRSDYHRAVRPISPPLVLCLSCLAMSCLAVACTFNDERDHCTDSSGCEEGQGCYQGFCIRDEEEEPDPEGGSDDIPSSGNGTGTKTSANTAAGASGGNTAGTRGSSRGGTGGSGRAGRGGTAESGRGGSGEAGSGGAAGSGMSSGNGGASGEDAPPPDPGMEDECSADEERPCLVDGASATASEVCTRGVQRCSGGRWARCAGDPMPEAEQCNGLDDDCDQNVDEQSEELCYPDGEAGCMPGQGGAWTCVGSCATGTRACVQGSLGECTGVRVPASETCTAAGAAAADENCDGRLDESCTCMSGETRMCYSGRTDTLNVGKCRPGTQACTDGQLGACTNEVTPTAETCANPNVDDDCDGMPDNIANLNGPCVIPNNTGICRAGTLQCPAGATEPTCVAVRPMSEFCNGLDDDCNGRVDESFNLQTDVNNCGSCGTRCATGERCEMGDCQPAAMSDGGMPMMPACEPACGAGSMCCGTTCVDTANDVMNCGMCGTRCTAGSEPGCCNGRCVDLLSNTTCGGCNSDCSLLGTGGITCTCKRNADDSISCSGPLLDLCL